MYLRGEMKEKNMEGKNKNIYILTHIILLDKKRKKCNYIEINFLIYCFIIFYVNL